MNNSYKNITVIGSGHGGLALSGFLALQGHDVTLYAHHNHIGALNEVAKSGNVTLAGKINGIGKINLTTLQIDLAILNAEVIFIVLPVIAHESIFTTMLPFLQNGQIIINLSGRFSGIFQNEILKQHPKDIYIADTTSFPFACRILKSCEVEIVAVKNNIGIASTSVSKTKHIINHLKIMFPIPLEIKSSFLEIGFYDPSGISHVPNTIFNAGRIGNGNEFYFYKDGITRETALVLEQIDQERIIIGKYLGLNLPPYYEVMNKYYGLNHTSIFDFFKHSPIHNASKFCPSALNNRYLTEDVPYSLVPWYSAGLNFGYTASITKNIIEIASIFHQTNYIKNGRQLTKKHIQDYHLCG